MCRNCLHVANPHKGLLGGANGIAIQVLLDALPLRYQCTSGPSPAGAMPPQPPPALAPALSAGLLPCLERLVRRAGDGAALSGGTSTAVLTAEEGLLGHLFNGCSTDPYLAWLLAYGSPTEAAALVVSTGKLLRAVTAATLPLTLQKRDRYLLTTVNAAATTLLAMSEWVFSGLLCDAAAGAAAGTAARGMSEGGGLGPDGQLRRIAVLAACEWLPVLSGLVIGTTGRIIYVTSHMQVSALQLSSCAAAVLANALNACVLWLPTGAANTEAAGGGGPSGSAAPSAGVLGGEAQGQGGAGALGGRQLRALEREGRVVELLGAGMRLEVYMLSWAARDRAGGGSGGAAVDPDAREQRVVRLLTAAFRLAVSSPDLVRLALAGRAWAARAFPAHCMWSSGVVRQLLGSLPGGCGAAVMLAQALEAWEGGEDVSIEAKAGSAPRTTADEARARFALSELLEGEQQQQGRRCSWWRCTNLAGDSEAGLPLRACARCGGAWYRGRECQAAHWRERHKGECW